MLVDAIDRGLEFLDVTAQLQVARIRSRRTGDGQEDVDRITNTSASPVDTHLRIVVHGLAAGVALDNASGAAHSGDPYRREFLPDGVLAPGDSLVETLRFSIRRPAFAPPVSYTLALLSGQGNP